MRLRGRGGCAVLNTVAASSHHRGLLGCLYAHSVSVFALLRLLLLLFLVCALALEYAAASLFIFPFYRFSLGSGRLVEKKGRWFAVARIAGGRSIGGGQKGQQHVQRPERRNRER